MKNDVIEFW